MVFALGLAAPHALAQGRDATTAEALFNEGRDAAKAALADAHVQQRLEALGAMPVGSAPADFARYVRAQTELMGRIVREARIEIG